MALTPEDVVNKRFQPTKFREGYDQDEVDDFLDEIVLELRRLYQENDELRQKVAELEGELSGRGGFSSAVSNAAGAAEKTASKEDKPAKEGNISAVSDNIAKPATQVAAPATGRSMAVPGTGSAPESAAGVLAMAQKLHDDYVNAGIEQRDKIIAEAQIEASSLVNDAQEKSRKTLGALEQQRSLLERKVEQLRSFERDYRARLKSYIQGQLRDLDAQGSVAAPDVSDSSGSIGA